MQHYTFLFACLKLSPCGSVANTSQASPIRSFLAESEDGDVGKTILVTGS
jgi:hypothetical protein